MEMQLQMRMDFLPLTEPEDAGESIEEQFRAFHAANPHIYRLLRALALDYKRSGQSHCGIKMLYEVLRYRSGVYTTGEPYKLNNNFTSLYARMLMDREPELRGFFEIRERRAD